MRAGITLLALEMWTLKVQQLLCTICDTTPMLCEQLHQHDLLNIKVSMLFYLKAWYSALLPSSFALLHSLPFSPFSLYTFLLLSSLPFLHLRTSPYLSALPFPPFSSLLPLTTPLTSFLTQYTLRYTLCWHVVLMSSGHSFQMNPSSITKQELTFTLKK